VLAVDDAGAGGDAGLGDVAEDDDASVDGLITARRRVRPTAD
jgi:hypothetical protein